LTRSRLAELARLLLPIAALVLLLIPAPTVRARRLYGIPAGACILGWIYLQRQAERSADGEG